MTQVTKLLSALAFLTFTTPLVGASVFDRADALFAERENNLAKIAQARLAYHQVLNRATGPDAVYAVQQLGKLAYYEGELLTSLKTNPDRRTEIFAECRNFVEKIANQPAAFTQYSYWKLLCTAFWVQSAPLLSRLGQVSNIKRYFDTLVGENLEPRPGLGLDHRYMYGGMYRVLAGVYREDLSSMVRSGLPNLDKSLQFADRALSTEPAPGFDVGGDLYYSNHRGRTELLLQMGRTHEARAFLLQSIEEIEALLEANQLPADIVPEAKAELRNLKALKARF